MIRLRVSGKVLLVLLLLPCTILFYGLFSSLVRAAPRHVMTTPSTPGLAVFGKPEDKLEEVVNEVAEHSVERRRSVVQPRHDVEIWGKASIAEYLWSHILGGNASTYANGLLGHGEMALGDLHLRYRSGPGIIQNTVPNTVKHLVLVINGKDDLKIRFSRSWLDYLVHFRHLRHVALVVLGSEQCDNQWLRPYLKSHGGLVDLVFLVYDSPLVDGKEVFQWPLGVATYRGFPQFRSDRINVKTKRQYLCNFYGTVYKNSSRENLIRSIPNASKCDLQTRDTWIPSESFASMEKYLRTLSDSDLTLNPVGKNTECYRIYEALALGSVPVVEDVMTPGQCVSPLRLLKQHQAPLLFIKSWDELPGLLVAEGKLNLNARVARRKVVVRWYEDFKHNMKKLFLDTIRKVFFKKNESKTISSVLKL